MANLDDDDLVLSSSTQAALAEFLAEQQAKDSQTPSLRIGKLQPSYSGAKVQLSQFWYDDKTADTLAKELLYDTRESSVIAIISAPSVYAKIRQISPRPKVYLFEYDSRFERLVTKPDGFINYDYNNPLRIPAALRGKVDRVLADPPFLSDECLTRTAMSVRTLLKKDGGRTMVCTGQKMEDLVPKLFPGVRKVDFEPKHKGGLANAFACFMDWNGRDI